LGTRGFAKQSVAFGFVLVLLAPLQTPTLASEQADDQPEAQWTPELVLKVKPVGSVRVSPDGGKVAYVVGEASIEGEKSEWVSHIHVSNTDGSDSFQLTRGEKSASFPSWSPDGRYIAFLSSRGSEKSNIWRILVNGGEAERITDEKGGVSVFEWSPDLSQIAFLMPEPETEEEEKAKKEKRDQRVIDEDLKMTDLYVVSLERSEGGYPVRKLTKSEFSVGSFRGGGRGGIDWSPNGKSIVFTPLPTPKFNDWTQADISVVDVESSVIRSLVSSSAAEFWPLYSPDENWIAYVATDDPPTWGITYRVYVIRASGGEPRALAKTHDQLSTLLGWSQDGSSLLVSETHRTVRRLVSLPLNGGSPIFLTPQDRMTNRAALNRTGTHIGFTSEAPDVPSEAFVSSATNFLPTQVSWVQDLPNLPIGRTEVIQWKSFDGMPIEGLLTYPVGYQQGTRVPLLTIVHGGPAGAFSQRFIGQRGAYPIAAFAARGYAILRCNVRGSAGYGRDFRYANYEDWGGGDYQDIMTGVDHVIEMGVADPERLGIMGWSYGGFMTSWIITQSDRFKAASVGAGITNLMSFTGTADIPGFVPDYFRGEFWDVFDKWASHSAMFNIKGVATPTLIQHGEQDRRVPISQGYELYNALKRQGLEVKMVVYPRQPHGIQEPKLQLDAMKRNLEWFDQWLMEKSNE